VTLHGPIIIITLYIITLAYNIVRVVLSGEIKHLLLKLYAKFDGIFKTNFKVKSI